MRNFINISEIPKKELRLILDNAKSRKEKRSDLNKNAIDSDAPLNGKILVMIFEKLLSTRTRISFDLAVKQLGGKSLILNPDEIHYGSGNESLYDTAKIISLYADIVMLRSTHKNLVEFSKHLDVPIINGLTDLSHPCQIISDILTFEELKGPIKNKKIAWLGDGNNVVYSLIEAAVKFEFELFIACPQGFEPNKNILQWAKKNKGNILVIKDPIKAASSADCVMTDKWISMGDKINKNKKKKALKPYQVNKKIMNVANKDAIFMHCLPANRGEEVTNEVIDGKQQSAVWLEALNRIHAQKSIIEWCLNT